MKKSILLAVLTVIFVVIVLNINASTKQCINYECHTSKIPLYLKVLDFFDRDVHYKILAKDILKDAKTEEGRVLKILEWTYGNIKRLPQGFPIIDDHIWYTIVRGYGVDDQFQDVFTTLCNYAELDTFFGYVYNKNEDDKKCLSFVKMKNGWTVFDAYNGVYFKNKEERIASIEDIISGDWQSVNLGKNAIADSYYTEYFNSLASVSCKQRKLSRPTLQSPVNRFIFLFKKKK